MTAMHTFTILFTKLFFRGADALSSGPVEFPVVSDEFSSISVGSAFSGRLRAKGSETEPSPAAVAAGRPLAGDESATRRRPVPKPITAVSCRSSAEGRKSKDAPSPPSSSLSPDSALPPDSMFSPWRSSMPCGTRRPSAPLKTASRSSPLCPGAPVRQSAAPAVQSAASAVKGAVSAKGGVAPAGAGDGGAWECLPLGPLRAEIRAVFPASPKSSDAALDGSRESAARPRGDLAFPLELSISPPRSICLVSLQTYRQNLRLADDFHHRPAAGETG